MPQIIHIDDFIIVVGKPAGIPSVSLKKGEEGTLAAWILKRYPDQAALPKGKLEAGLVHRLDNDTSGVIVAARSVDVYENLRRQLDEGLFQKEYLALVMGNPPEEGKIDMPIANHPTKNNRVIVLTDKRCEPNAQPAHTEFRVEQRFKVPNMFYSLLSIRIKTGVRHQIRAHLASLGFPLAGDRLYQNSKLRKMDKLKLNRHFLHAKLVAFTHPQTGKLVKFEAPLPNELQNALTVDVVC